MIACTAAKASSKLPQAAIASSIAFEITRTSMAGHAGQRRGAEHGEALHRLDRAVRSCRPTRPLVPIAWRLADGTARQAAATSDAGGAAGAARTASGTPRSQ